MADYLVTYRPLVHTRAGRHAAATYRLPPFIDASCRREPDLAHDMPAITALCRGRMFAPRLRAGDRVIYMTKVGRWDNGSRDSVWKLVAAVLVAEVLPTHEIAAEWYLGQGQALPSNIMVPGNPPEPWERTSRWIRKELRERLGDPEANPIRTIAVWDAQYRGRAHAHPAVAVCSVISRRLWTPPTVTRGDWVPLFGGVPHTLTPSAINEPAANALMSRLRGTTGSVG